MHRHSPVSFVVVALVSSLSVRRSAAADPRSDCSTAYVSRQELERRSELLRAQEQLLVCAADPCPSALQPECRKWLANVERSIPSVVIAARTRSRREVSGVRLYVDGRLTKQHLDGGAI